MNEKDNRTICTLCHNPLVTELIRSAKGNDKTYTVYLCKECDVGITVPTPSPEELSGLYTSGSYRVVGGKRFNRGIESLVHFFEFRRKQRIGKFVKQGSILDVGCGRGIFLNIMKENGWEVAGVEFSKETAAYTAGNYGISVAAGNPRDWGFVEESFDVITMNHVLEHVHKPMEMLDESKRLLKRGGLLVIAVPNMASLQAIAGGRKWFHLDVPYHLCHFSEQGLLRLLRERGFRILRIRRFDFEHNPFGWLQTLLNLSGIRRNFFYNILKAPELRRKELSDSKVPDLILTFLLLPLYIPLSFLLSAFESFILKRGGTIELYAVKE